MSYSFSRLFFFACLAFAFYDFGMEKRLTARSRLRRYKTNLASDSALQIEWAHFVPLVLAVFVKLKNVQICAPHDAPQNDIWSPDKKGQRMIVFPN